MPTKIKQLHGETRPSRLNPNEPQPAHPLPQMPADLGPAAQEIWNKVMAEMGATGVITGADCFILRHFSEAEARYEHAAKLLDETGVLLQARGHGARAGELVKNPLHQAVHNNALLALAMARELGLSPSSRANLHVETMAPPSRMSQLMKPRTG